MKFNQISRLQNEVHLLKKFTRVTNSTKKFYSSVSLKFTFEVQKWYIFKNYQNRFYILNFYSYQLLLCLKLSLLNFGLSI